MSECQPIATAPKDRTVIDICGLNWKGEWERWCSARWEVDYDDGPASWKGPWSDGCDSALPDQRFKPTHWMRPPEFPERSRT